MQSPTCLLLHESNCVGVEFLLMQLRVGNTFLNLAREEQTLQCRMRYLGRVSSIYTMVRRMMCRVQLMPHEADRIEEALAIFASTLLADGLMLVP